MDMMALRRMVMAQMASGANYANGTITIGADWYNYVFQFGKTFNKYLYYFEMTDESKTALMNSGSTATDNTFALLGAYPTPNIDSTPATTYSMRTYVNVSNSTVARGTSTDGVQSCDPTSMTLQCRGLSTTTAFYRGYTYNYYIVEIK